MELQLGPHDGRVHQASGFDVHESGRQQFFLFLCGREDWLDEAVVALESVAAYGRPCGGVLAHEPS